MAQDDYDVVTYKILIYLYACFKGKIIFDETSLKHAAGDDLNKKFFENVLRLMSSEKLISGADFTKCWGGEFLLISDLSDMEITSEGIHYLYDNARMKKVQEYLLSTAGAIVSLIKMAISQN